MTRKILILLLLSFLIGSFTLSPQATPSWWEIKIHLRTVGDYTVKEGKKSYDGHYSFILLWTGCMERDMDDYLIYHETSKLLQWKADEKTHPSDIKRILSVDNFSGKPRFDFHYILRKGEDLHFDFQVEGFSVPQNNSGHKFYLTLPASAENTKQPSQFDYNAFVSEGSNSLYLQEKEIYLTSIEKTSNWKWRHQKWLSGEKKPVFFSNSHEAKVTVSIIPRY